MINFFKTLFNAHWAVSFTLNPMNWRVVARGKISAGYIHSYFVFGPLALAIDTIGITA